ncbi:hypothetical protein A2331_01720 [Candidatus Falkowbacteria bacterium RIFOXYB2_FULL_34_18]|uniref:Uncharacterized protein n=1 Tax=Candidatus Falkowbacteria bacterium RIFOXYD2_FULL_34_120 TaxID=1798007 RepID=A0A1F5TQA4_9BACT|nr:MAG: hypothetical protein A2331_01720 [Candidatus Falkowbacteria bacterium RIFOXYB2_FULL_34_18]OGF29330.1 MAG: hypothetical protein A2500_05600 [Candidatus Falkowbacteria bacterium RIFOXYC12_FULL_34_55]OGF36446.1 MAG: hypothetical protein A2466_01260 [Candidatus Falkowbacteria bacterium RIFOXYC2_FULL_34_220]OGF38925.1 MAG: hypothetical protein A2515_06020 [Candidatus Falkowbacteria bacterium RIFOXYD12_FULL_34_57]OGF40944.1 MAG: hypothetical protein A2531_04245 [Candidatus Falkowbacteria bact
MKVLLQEPIIPPRITYGKFSAGTGNNTFPYGLASMAEFIRIFGYSVSYLEPNIEKMSIKQYCKYLADNNFDVIGIGSTTLQMKYAINTFRLIKKVNSNIITVLGGVHGTIMPHETLRATRAIDYLILGEGEKSFKKLLDYIQAGKKELIDGLDGVAFQRGNHIIVKSPNENDYLKEDELCIPAYDLFPMQKYVAQITYAKKFPSYSIVASRGCPFKCSFCCGSSISGHKVRYKNIDKLIDEIELLKNKYRARGIFFLDSTFTLNKEWVEEFCKKFIEKKIKIPWACNSRVDTVNEEMLRLMKRAGCWEILFGVESANQKSLDLIKKNTTVEMNTYILKLSQKMGFYTYATYIIGLPGETENDALNTISYAKKIGTPLAMFYLPVPFPKTELWHICKKDGGLRDDCDWDEYNLWDASNPVYINPLIGKEKMKRLLRYAYQSYYFTPKVLLKNLSEFILFRQSFRKYAYGLMALGGFVFSKK